MTQSDNHQFQQYVWKTVRQLPTVSDYLSKARWLLDVTQVLNTQKIHIASLRIGVLDMI
jgi:hypothetical protein